MTLCSSRKSIPNTMSKSSILTVTKSVCPIQIPSLMGVLFATPNTGKAVELATFIFPTSRCQKIFKRFALVSVMKLWVAPELTMVFLAALWFTQISTYIRSHSTDFSISSTIFWRADKYFSAPTWGYPTVLSNDVSVSTVSYSTFELARNFFWKAHNAAFCGHSDTWWAPLHMKQEGGLWLWL